NFWPLPGPTYLPQRRRPWAGMTWAIWARCAGFRPRTGSALRRGVRKEQLLAVDPIRGDGTLPLGGQDPVDELLSLLGLHVGVFLGVDQNDAILVEHHRIAFDRHGIIALVDERDPGG